MKYLNNLDLAKNQLLNAVLQNLASAPTSPVEGQFYYDTTDKKLYYYNGTAWVDSTYLLPIATSSSLGGVIVGSGLAIDGNGILSATGTNVDIINNLTSTRVDAALSANMGKQLNDTKAPNNHATTATTYGVGSTTNYGHVKATNGNGLSITNGALAMAGATTSVVGATQLNDTMTSTSVIQAATANVAKMLKDLIDTLNTQITNLIASLGTAAYQDTGSLPGDVVVVEANGKINPDIMPDIAIMNVNTVNSEAAMLALTAQIGDIAIRTDINKTFILSKEPPTVLANWVELLFPVAVSSVNGKTGIVVLTGNDIEYSSGVTLNQKINDIAIKKYTTATVGGSATQIINHNLNTKNIFISLYTNDTGDTVYTDIERSTSNSITLRFGATIPSANSITCNIMAM